MNRDLKALLAEFIANRLIVESWGIEDLKVSESGISFFAYGLLYQGNIRILFDNEGYGIFLSGVYIKTVEIGRLVKELDSLIEYDIDYNQKLRDWVTRIILRTTE